MRTAFIETLCELAEQDKRIWLLTGDLGYSVLEHFANRFPNRYVNVGVAEQSMTGVAAGLALCSKIVFIYSIANFPIMRCLEQIRNDVCYHSLSVKIVAVGGGLAYGSAGYTHHAVEDLAVMRSMPNMTVIAPSDPVETQLATKAIVDWPGPCYLRLGKAGEPVVHQLEPEFQVGRAIVVRDGTKVTLISTGGILKTVVEAANLLEDHGVSTRVVSMHTVSPIDREEVLRAAEATEGILTIEEHMVVGGLASAVGAVLAQSNRQVKFARVGLRHDHLASIGSQEYLRGRNSLSPLGIVRSALCLLEEY